MSHEPLPQPDEPLRSQFAARQALLDRVRSLLVRQLGLRREPDEIDPDTPLFGTGLGLDSVDAVELVVGVEAEFGIKVPEGRVAAGALRTVNGVVDFVLIAQEARRAH